MGKKQKKAAKTPPTPPLSELLRLPPGPVDPCCPDPRATPGFPGKDKSAAPAAQAVIEPELFDLQERLYAAGRTGQHAASSVLVVLQGWTPRAREA